MRPSAWQVALLVPAPVLSLLYLFGIRTGRLTPSFLPVWLLGVPPVVAGGGAALDLLRRTTATRGGSVAVLAAAGIEVGWLVLCGAIVGFAIAWRSG